jgi:hypothetical protein
MKENRKEKRGNRKEKRGKSIPVLLKGLKIEFCRPPNPSALHLRCFVYFDESIGDVLPYP